jgi:hypothetical protein
MPPSKPLAKIGSCGTGATVTHAESSEELPVRSVAAAVTTEPAESCAGVVKRIVAPPFAAVWTSWPPRRRSAGPRPLPSHCSLA